MGPGPTTGLRGEPGHATETTHEICGGAWEPLGHWLQPRGQSSGQSSLQSEAPAETSDARLG